MIIKPAMGARVFWAAAGITLLITGCSMSVLVFPVGLVILCIALPLAVCSFGFAFGATQTRIDDEGIFQRNFFFMTKKLDWNEVEAGKIESANYTRTDSSGWSSRGTRTYLLFTGAGRNIHVSAGDTGPENWWSDIQKIAREKLGDKFNLTVL
jgi:hypothetical protein